MQLYPTSNLTKLAGKTLRNHLKVQLTADLASFLNQEFATETAKFADTAFLNKLVGKYYQTKSNQLLGKTPVETN